MLLVLDDYHLVNAGPVHESVAFLLENLPPGLLLVVCGRLTPLPLARLRPAFYICFGIHILLVPPLLELGDDHHQQLDDD